MSLSLHKYTVHNNPTIFLCAVPLSNHPIRKKGKIIMIIVNSSLSRFASFNEYSNGCLMTFLIDPHQQTNIGYGFVMYYTVYKYDVDFLIFNFQYICSNFHNL